MRSLVWLGGVLVIFLVVFRYWPEYAWIPGWGVVVFWVGLYWRRGLQKVSSKGS